MSDTNDMRILAQELRRVRMASPATVGDAMGLYGQALHNARRHGVETATLLCIGELMWMALRPEEESVPEAIARALDAFWAKYEADLAFCDPSNGPRYRQ